MPCTLDTYASHLPILRALSLGVEMRRVLEFGAGMHSTPFFLGLEELEKLVTVETDPEWRTKIAEDYPDRRLKIRATRPRSLVGFDFIFVDDGVETGQREATIRWVLSRPHPPVVIHDADVYRKTIEEMAPAEHFTFHTNPQTELVR